MGSDTAGEITRIVLPNRATVAESAQLIQACSDAEFAEGPVELSAEETSFFGPFGVALLAATMAIRRGRARGTTLALPVDVEAREFVKEVGLEAFAKGGTPGPGTLQVRQLQALDALYTEKVTALLVQGVEGITEDSAYLIQLCLNELLQNVFEWSRSSIGCTVHARWYLKTRSVRLAVVDRGIGIPAALRGRRVRDLQRATDAEVIEAAVTTPQLTSRANQVGGLGLKHIREWVCGRGGRLTVVSLGAKVVWSGPKVSRRKGPRLRGTAVEIDFRPTDRFVRTEEEFRIF